MTIFLISINGIIKRSTAAVLAIEKIDDSFHARFSCTEREYEYWIINSPFRHPLLEERAYWVKGRLDMLKIIENSSYLPGKQFFNSFTPPSTLLDRTSERTITEVNVVQAEDYPGLLKIKIRGSGFLHNMVRIIVGTLIDIGRGKIKNRNMKEIIEARDRNKAGITLPPYGLYFIKAHYENYPEIERLYMKNHF